SMPAGFDLAGLIHIDTATGQVTYDRDQFKFLTDDEVAVFIIDFQSQFKSLLFPEQLTLTITGLNDPPVFNFSNTALTIIEPHEFTSLAHIAREITLPFTDPDFSDVSSAYSVALLGVSVSGNTSGLPSNTAIRDALLKSFLKFES